jgi:hypothetical protein
MESRPACGDDARMIDVAHTHTGRSRRDPSAVSREARRFVGLERHYRCGACGAERHSWARMSACPDCGEAYVVAVIRRAAITAA